MKIKISYTTKEKIFVSEFKYQYQQKEIELEPVMITRTSCGKGAAANRYRYHGFFKKPCDARFPSNGFIKERIDRKWNPMFNPNELEFKDDVWRT